MTSKWNVVAIIAAITIINITLRSEFSGTFCHGFSMVILRPTPGRKPIIRIIVEDKNKLPPEALGLSGNATSSRYYDSIDQDKEEAKTKPFRKGKPAKDHEEDLKLTRRIVTHCLDERDLQIQRQERRLTISNISSTVSNVSSTAYLGIVSALQAETTPAIKIKQLFNVPAVEIILSVLVVLNSFAVAIDTLPKLPVLTRQLVDMFQDTTAFIFLGEAMLRWWSSDVSTLRHFSRPLNLADILVSIPLCFANRPAIRAFLPRWLTTTEGLQNLRLLRILRLQRILQDKSTFTNFLKGLGLPPFDVRPYQLQLARVVISIFTLLSVSSGFIYAVEHVVNPNISNYFMALYFGLCTLTTVGFGDIYPMTAAGRLVVSLSIFAGVVILPAQGASLVEALLQQSRGQHQRAEENAEGSTAMADTTLAPARTMNVNDQEECSNCGAPVLAKAARYCWSCGYKLTF
jgi:voltage-gated potassium channel